VPGNFIPQDREARVSEWTLRFCPTRGGGRIAGEEDVFEKSSPRKLSFLSARRRGQKGHSRLAAASSFTTQCRRAWELCSKAPLSLPLVRAQSSALFS